MVVRDAVYEAFTDGVPSPAVQSYGGHSASAAAAAKALELYEDGRMDVVAEELGAKLEVRLNVCWQHELVLDIRRLGAWAVLELRDPDTGESLARGLHGSAAGIPTDHPRDPSRRRARTEHEQRARGQ